MRYGFTIFGLFSFVGLFAFQGGCSQTRQMTIVSSPVPAQISVDGADRGHTPLRQEFVFSSSKPVYHLTAAARGYKDQSLEIARDNPSTEIDIQLKPLTKHVTFTIWPLPALVTIDNRPVSGSMVSNFQADLEFTVDDHDRWTTHKIVAERPGFQPIEKTVSWPDHATHYTLTLEQMRKDVTIRTTPPGASVMLDEEDLGVSPLTQKAVPFSINPQSDQWNQYRLRISKPGYDSIDTNLGWDDGRTDYSFDLPAKHKTVRILTDPPDARITIDGKEAARAAGAALAVPMVFAPVNDRGDLRTYEVIVSKKTDDADWEPAKLTLGWDAGRTDYTIALKEIKTIPVPLVSIEPTRSRDGWQLLPRRTMTLAMRRDVGERLGRLQPSKLTNLPKGTIIDSLAISPDGSQIVFTVLQPPGDDSHPDDRADARAGTQPTDFCSQMMLIHTNGGAGVESFGDGKSLDIQPTFSPDGKQIVFSSNRAGRRQSIWSMASSGASGVSQHTSGDSNDLWPMVDAARRLFYQAMVDTRPDPRLFMSELGKTTRTDLTQAGCMQPRVSPDASPETGSILFTSVNEKTGKRDIFRMPIKSGIPENLTNTPDADEYDPAWSPDGSRMAYVSDAGADENHRHYYSIWLMNLTDPDSRQPIQITTNGSWDDRPVWDPSGNALYFRSNRGGEWAIWKIPLK